MEHEIKAAPKFLILEVPAEEETTEGGIILASRETPSTAWAKVVSVGADADEHFLLDDVVLFRRRDAMPFSADGVEMLAILHDQVLATKRSQKIDVRLTWIRPDQEAAYRARKDFRPIEKYAALVELNEYEIGSLSTTNEINAMCVERIFLIPREVLVDKD